MLSVQSLLLSSSPVIVPLVCIVKPTNINVTWCVMQSAAASGVTADCSNDVQIKWTLLKKQPTQYDGQ